MAASGGHLTIGKVVERLKPTYPDLSVSKIRYLQDEGLVNPSRSEGGYRLYSERDVQRLETVLRLQKTRFLPLAVIREELKRLDSPSGHTAPKAAQPAAADRVVVPDDSEEAVNKLHPIDRMPELLSVSVSFVRALAEAGLIAFKRSPQGRDLVDGKDLKLIRICDELKRYGFEPRVLRQYVTAANRESLSIEQALVTYSTKAGGVELANNEENRTRYERAFSDMISLTNDLRTILIQKRVRNSFPTEDES